MSQPLLQSPGWRASQTDGQTKELTNNYFFLGVRPLSSQDLYRGFLAIQKRVLTSRQGLTLPGFCKLSAATRFCGPGVSH